jgi:hypothetical protein
MTSDENNAKDGWSKALILKRERESNCVYPLHFPSYSRKYLSHRMEGFHRNVPEMVLRKIIIGPLGNAHENIARILWSEDGITMRMLTRPNTARLSSSLCSPTPHSLGEDDSRKYSENLGAVRE